MAAVEEDSPFITEGRGLKLPLPAAEHNSFFDSPFITEGRGLKHPAPGR